MNTTVTRSISGIVFLAVMIGAILAGRYWFLFLFLLLAEGMLEEFFKMTLGKTHKAIRGMAMGIVCVAFALVALVTGPGALSAQYLALLPLMLVLLLATMVFKHQEFKENAYILAGLLYIGLPMILSPLVVSQPDGSYSGILMLSFFILIWASDTGAYCFGMLFGQKLWPAKLCPTISPKKSWAGAVGGMVASLLAAWILCRVGWLPYPPVHVLVMAALMNVLGVCGDLFESLWKRQFGLKDSGNLIPGHGGLLDRFDSALFAIPAGYVYLLLFQLV